METWLPRRLYPRSDCQGLAPRVPSALTRREAYEDKLLWFDKAEVSVVEKHGIYVILLSFEAVLASREEPAFPPGFLALKVSVS